ncbi:hypothetical protein ACFE04_031132 [Oxalis oulophora]
MEEEPPPPPQPPSSPPPPSSSPPHTLIRYRNSISTTHPYYNPTNHHHHHHHHLPSSTSMPPLPSVNGVTPPSPKIDLSFLQSSTSYTSLRDLIPSPNFKSPTATAADGEANYFAAAGGPGNGGQEITIRNRLVKQAAWAYLRPMSSSSGSSASTNILTRIWMCLSDRNPLSVCLRFINDRITPALTRLVDRILSILRVS